MTESDKDAGIIEVLLERFEKQRLPRTLALKEKVDKGEALDDWETAHLEELLEDARQVKTLIDKHPDYQELYTRAVHLYKEITDKALENAKGSESTE